MTVQDLLDALSDYGYTDTSNTRKVAVINAVVWDISSREPWPFLEKSVNLTFDGTSAVPSNVPTDLQAVLDITRLDTGMKLQPLRLQEMDSKVGFNLDQTGDAPVYYYFLAGQLRVAPIPGAAFTARMRYVAKHPVLAQTDPESAILIPREHHEAILFGALIRLSDMEDDTELGVRFGQLYEQHIQTMRQSVWMRQYDRTDHIQITDVYDNDYEFYL